jgi:hypothetical protein
MAAAEKEIVSKIAAVLEENNKKSFWYGQRGTTLVQVYAQVLLGRRVFGERRRSPVL